MTSKAPLLLLALLTGAFLASAAEASAGQATLTAYPDPAFNAVGTTRTQIVGVVQDGVGPVADVAVEVTVTGANEASGDCTTGNDGLCQVQYVGDTIGVDTITATAAVNGTPLQDETTTEWEGKPENDDFSDAVVINSLPFMDEVVNVAATMESQEQTGCGNMAKSVWYRLSVSTPTTIGASTDDSGFRTSLAIYRGTSLANLDLLDCDQFDPGPPPPASSVPAGVGVLTNVSIAADLEPGNTYYIQAGGYGTEYGELKIDVYTTGTVSGRLFLDLNENGEFDDGDEGIGEHLLTLTSTSESRTVHTLADGGFDFLVPAGDYLLQADPKFTATLCITGAFPFNPTSLDDCVSPPLPRIFTSQNPQAVLVESSQVTQANIIVRTGDAMVLTGIALLENGIAPEGTEVTAMKGATECGVTQVTSADAHEANYELTIIGAGEQADCAQPGDTVTIKVGQTQAAEEIVYQATPNSFHIQTLSALGDRAWFWTQKVLLPNAGVPSGQIQAKVNGVICGSANLQTAQSFSQKVSGFSALIVDGQSLDPACGESGETVSFSFDGAIIGTATWQPGLSQVRLDIPGAIDLGDLDCSGVVNQEDLLFALKRLGALVPHSQCSPFASDMNCDLTFDGKDILRLLYWLAGLADDQPDGCPEIGATLA